MPDDDAGQPGKASDIGNILADPNLRFPEHPRLTEDLLVYAMPDGLGVQIRGVVEPLVVRGRQASEAILFLSSISARGLSLPEILKAAPSTIPESSILRALLVLHSRGLIVDAFPDQRLGNETASPTPAEAKAALFWSRHLGISGSCASSAAVAKSFASSAIMLLGNGLFCAVLLETLVRSGFFNIMVLNWRNCAIVRDAFYALDGSLRRGEHVQIDSLAELRNFESDRFQPSLFVTALRVASDDVFEEVNRVCLRNRWPCLRGAETPEQFEIGPLVQPYESACLTCMRLRRRGVTEFPIEETLFQDHFEQNASKLLVLDGGALNGEAAAVALVPAGMLAMECIRVASAVSPPALVNSQISFRPLDGEIVRNRILRVPHCPDCQVS
jgi:bacteriocin biosynthesis cyclodehydratase domain-containing protein